MDNEMEMLAEEIKEMEKTLMKRHLLILCQ